jgi:hypothetical protein
MDPIQSIVTACAAMVLLVAIVAAKMVADRSREMRERRIHPQQVATSRTAAQHYEAVQAADNYRNLFELPVLFYAWAALVIATGHASEAMAAGAWAYVALRVVHSLVHCTYNKVMHRFAVFALSILVLVGLWAALLLAVGGG